MPHLDDEHVLLQALLNSNFYRLSEKWLVLYQIVDQGEFVFKVVEDCRITRTIISQRYELPKILIELVTSPKLPQLITLNVVLINLLRLGIGIALEQLVPVIKIHDVISGQIQKGLDRNAGRRVNMMNGSLGHLVDGLVDATGLHK